ncbi:MAG TPA: AGE family epimerase/isomerase [Rhizomicrobium sp.]
MPKAISLTEAIVTRVENWLFQSAMPLWCAQGITAHGLAVEELDFSGQPKDVGYHRTMVQFRQIHCLAMASLAGHADPRLAHNLFDRVTQSAWHRGGGWVHRLDCGGKILDDTREACDQAFALLATASVFNCTDDKGVLDKAHATLEFLDREMSDANDGFREAIPYRLPRRQNAHMHFLEAFLALYEVTEDRRFLERAEDMIALLTERFVDGRGFLHECFDANWARNAAEEIEPGHHFEWVWLLSEYARLSDAPVPGLARNLFLSATRYGIDGNGLAVAKINSRGEICDDTKMLWAQTEMLKAHIARAEHAKEDHDVAIARIVGQLFAHFLLAAPAGIWHEKLDTQGAPIDTRMPASTFYHLTGAFMELLRFRGRMPRLLARHA